MRTTTLAVRERGQMTLPKALRDALRREVQRLTRRRCCWWTGSRAGNPASS